jgi:RNA polymerase sigma-70 factor (family 1)
MKPTTVYEDIEKKFWEQLIAGDHAGFTGIYNIYHSTLFNFIVKFVNSGPLAEDLTQEVFVKIWESRHRLKDVKSFKAYLFVTARNHTLNKLKEIFKSEIAIGEVIGNFAQLRSATEEEILHKEYLLFLKNVLENLPDRTKSIFKLCREQGKSYEEVAAALNISRNAVKNHMVHAMKILGTSVKKEFGISLSLLLLLYFKH